MFLSQLGKKHSRKVFMEFSCLEKLSRFCTNLIFFYLHQNPFYVSKQQADVCRRIFQKNIQLINRRTMQSIYLIQAAPRPLIMPLTLILFPPQSTRCYNNQINPQFVFCSSIRMLSTQVQPPLKYLIVNFDKAIPKFIFAKIAVKIHQKNIL